jgi:hypothetical protein
MAIYAAFLIVTSFGHHDLVCHVKNPQHCTACTANQLSADPHAPAVVGAWQLADAGRAVTYQPLDEGALLVRLSCGRSPPASFR